MQRIFLILAIVLTTLTAAAQKITVSATDRPAAEVFARIMRQTDRNFIYTSDILKGVRVTVNAKAKPLESVLRDMFAGTPIRCTFKGNNVILTRAAAPRKSKKVILSGYIREENSDEPLIGALVAVPQSKITAYTNAAGFYSLYVDPGRNTVSVSYPGYVTVSQVADIKSASKLNFHLKPAEATSAEFLPETIVYGDLNHSIAMNSADIGRINVSAADIRNTPVILGESDITKTLQLQPGVSGGTEGMAGMYVHGGTGDENLYLLDNIPLYQVNHTGGLFSAFNTEAIKNVDFYKSSFPARYNGRLSSVMDVHTKEGGLREHHGSVKLGLTSGAFNIDGPIWKEHTTYSFAIRRSWFELLTIPGLAIYNSVRDDNFNKTIARYAFTDINARITHRFSPSSSIYTTFYYGEDYLKGGENTKSEDFEGTSIERTSDIARLRWGNILASVGWNYSISPSLFLELTGAYTHFSSKLRRDNSRSTNLIDDEGLEEPFSQSLRKYTTANNITDWTLRAAFSWNAPARQRVDFGAEVTFHHFMPQDNTTASFNFNVPQTVNVRHVYNSRQASLYISDTWDISDALRLNVGLNGGLYNIESDIHWHLDPRLSLRWSVTPQLSLKASYARLSQFVHQLTQSNLSLPTDQWVPVMGTQKPQRSDNISIGGYYSFMPGFTVSLEGYWRWLHNLVDYADFYYLLPNETPWERKLATGSGSAKGVDLMIAKTSGKITGHVSYSLLWSDRKFAGINQGKPFPSKFDNRHKINFLASWRINDKWQVSAAWTGMSGNRFSLALQNYQLLPDKDAPFLDTTDSMTGSIDLKSGVNNYRLPFYHRLDLSANLYMRHGYWTFSLFNAYCNLNVISIRKTDNYGDLGGYSHSTFKKYRLIPVVPGVSYTWLF